jgi:hypothetical protein
MKAKVEVLLRRSGNRGRVNVDRHERFQADCSIKDGALCLGWTATNGQRNELTCSLPQMPVEASQPSETLTDGGK